MKKRLLTLLLAAALLVTVLPFGAAAAERPWESAYRAAIHDTMGRWGGYVHLVDLDLNGTPELLIGGIPGSGVFSWSEGGFTCRNGALVPFTGNEDGFALSSGGTFEEEDLPAYTLYQHDATGAYRIEGTWTERAGAGNYTQLAANLSLQNDSYICDLAFVKVTTRDEVTYYLNNQKTSYSDFLSAFRSRNDGWTKVDTFQPAIGFYNPKAPSDAEITQLFGSYSDYQLPGSKPTVGGFSDVYEGDFYAEPVVWAVSRGITKGTEAGSFSPNESCTRGQIVTFLHRFAPLYYSAGSPRTGSPVQFSDVPDKAYYAGSVSWAVSAGITQGTSAGVFSPNDDCTRAQAVTFLYRYAGSPEVPVTSAFSDVPANAYYAKAVSWAVAQGITKGTSTGVFSPNETCTRGQIVTFLYRLRAMFQAQR